MDAVELWRESLPDESRVEGTAGVALVGAGVLAMAFTLTRKRRGFLAWAVPGALIAAGIVMLADVTIDLRAERIEETSANIEAELAELDPVARAQVLKNVGQNQMRSLIPGLG